MSVGDVVYRADLETDRFDLVRAVPAWLLLTNPSVAKGLGTPIGFGKSLGPELHLSQDDEIALAPPPDAESPPPVSVFPVRDAPSIVRGAGRQRSARGVGRRRRTGRPRGRGRARRRQRRALLRDLRRRFRRPPPRDRAARFGARGHRHEPQARPPMGVDPRRRGGDRTRRRDCAHHRRGRRAPRPVPRRRPRRLHRGRVARRPGEHHALRQPHHVLAGDPRVARARRRREHRVARGRPRDGGRREDPYRPRPARHHRSRQPRPVARRAHRPVPHQGAVDVRRRRPCDRRPRRRITHRRGADGHVPDAHLPPARSVDRRDQRRATPSTSR